VKTTKPLLRSILTNVSLVALLWATGQGAFSGVSHTTQQRSAGAWQQDQQARERTLADVRKLLRDSLTPTTSAQIALLNNQGLRSTFEEIGLAEADVMEARTVPNPRLDISARFPDKPPSGTDVEWGIAQDFLNILMIPLKTKVAKDHLAAVQLRVSDEVTQLVAETKSTVYQLEAAEEILGHLKIEQVAQATSLAFVQNLHQAGNITDLQLLEQQGEYSQSRLEIAEAETNIRALREKLNRLMGLWGTDTTWKVASKIADLPKEDPSVPGLETLAITQRSDLAALRSEFQATLRVLGLEKTFRWVGALDFGIDSERQSDSQTITGPTFSLELPIFNQGQARIARNEAHLRRAYDRLEQKAIEIRSEVRELRDKLTSARDMAQFYRDSMIPVRTQTRDQMQLQYNAMIVSPLELFTARRQEVSAERAYIEARRDYWTARTELERTVGGSFSGNTKPNPKISVTKKN
jgi:cobalt-zinc-cadmium efflux system outer membrane protein